MIPLRCVFLLGVFVGSIVASGAVGAAEFTLGFEQTETTLHGNPGEVIESEARLTLTTSGEGARAQGFSYSVIGDGLRLVDISDGNCPIFPSSEAERCLSDPHFRPTLYSELALGGFSNSQVATGPAGACENAVVSGHTLSFAQSWTFPDFGDVAVVFFEATIPDGSDQGRLRYGPEACIGGGQAIETTVVVEGQSVTLETTLQSEDFVATLTSAPWESYARGDVNGDARLNIADPSALANWLFGLPGGSEPPCLDAADANGDGNVNIADPTFIANFVFGIASARPPPAPGPLCGRGALILGCESPPSICAWEP